MNDKPTLDTFTKQNKHQDHKIPVIFHVYSMIKSEIHRIAV